MPMLITIRDHLAVDFLGGMLYNVPMICSHGVDNNVKGVTYVII